MSLTFVAKIKSKKDKVQLLGIWARIHEKYIET